MMNPILLSSKVFFMNRKISQTIEPVELFSLEKFHVFIHTPSSTEPLGAHQLAFYEEI